MKRRSFLAAALGTIGSLPFLRGETVYSVILKSPLKRTQTITLNATVRANANSKVMCFIETPSLGRVEKIIEVEKNAWAHINQIAEIAEDEFAQARFGFGSPTSDVLTVQHNNHLPISFLGNTEQLAHERLQPWTTGGKTHVPPIDVFQVSPGGYYQQELKTTWADFSIIGELNDE